MTTSERFVGFTEDEVRALLAWLPKHDEPANTWERNVASVRRKLEALEVPNDVA